MNISRKEFFIKSLISLGEAVFTVGDALKNPSALPVDTQDKGEYEAIPCEDLFAVASNEQCLARSSGCFSCVERCQFEAIKLIPGIGVRINPQLCTGCGTCHYVCPVTPAAIRMQPRPPTVKTPVVPHPQKGESPC